MQGQTVLLRLPGRLGESMLLRNILTQIYGSKLYSMKNFLQFPNVLSFSLFAFIHLTLMALRYVSQHTYFLR